MFELKPLSTEAIPRSIEKAERYRFLNEPAVAESICQDILHVDPDNQQTLVTLILAITDQFDKASAVSVKQALNRIPQLHGEYERAYYTGIIYERQARAELTQGYPGSGFVAYEALRTAMTWFEKAEAIHPAGNEDAILRWNTCARLIQHHHLRPRPQDEVEHGLE